MSARLLIIGNGMAATRLCEELRARDPACPVTVVGAEPHPAYNRVLLSDMLARKVAMEDLALKPAAWWERHAIEVIQGVAATGIDRTGKTVTLADGQVLPYGRLVLATGSHPIRLPLPGADLPGVLTFRDLKDVEHLLAAARPGTRAVVIGGGLLGLEAASGLAAAGAETTLVHLMDRLMERQLDPAAAALLRGSLEARGVKVRLEAESDRIEGTDHVTGLRLKDGTLLPADLVVMACGVRPNADLARSAGLACGRGVLVGDQLVTSDADIFAIGECAEHRGAVYGLVAPAYEQARALAARLCGEWAAYEGSTVSTNLKVSGVHVFSAGDITGGPGCEDILLTDAGRGTYRRLILKDGRLVGAVLFGDTSDGLFYLDLITRHAPVAHLRADLAFGRSALDRAA